MSSLANTVTGEMLSRDASSVVQFLENAKWMLDAAVEMTGPADVANLKAQVVMADTYARELHLSKDIQEQSREMVRRAEYALGRAIRKGQEEGTVATRGTRTGQTADCSTTEPPPACSFATNAELYGDKRGDEANGILAMASVDPEAFSAALVDAKAEGNTSRSNVVRKIKGQQSPQGLTRQQRADLIEDLAAQGMTSRQMPARVGVTEETVRQIARDFNIDIPADRIVGRSRRIDHTSVVEKTVIDLENTAEFIQAHVDLSQVDFTEADEWVSSLSRSIAALNRFRNQLKEKTHV